MNLSADMREVWKRLGDQGVTVYGEREKEWQFLGYFNRIGNVLFDARYSAMQGCKL